MTAEAILCAPGRLHEVEPQVVDGQPQRVYKHLWLSLRDFWKSAVAKFLSKTYIVFEDQRFTYGEVLERVTKVAAVFREVYGIQKGSLCKSSSAYLSRKLNFFWRLAIFRR